MRFRQLDRITELVPGERVTAVRTLSGQEDYLKDHFPLFPVMPGVLMLEAMFQASSWLVRRTDNFGYAFVWLKEARNIKYTDFVRPGGMLVVTAEILKREGDLTTLKAQGTMEGATAVSARLIVERGHVVEREPGQITTDGYTRRKMKEFFDELYQPQSA